MMLNLKALQYAMNLLALKLQELWCLIRCLERAELAVSKGESVGNSIEHD